MIPKPNNGSHQCQTEDGNREAILKMSLLQKFRWMIAQLANNSRLETQSLIHCHRRGISNESHIVANL